MKKIIITSILVLASVFTLSARDHYKGFIEAGAAPLAGDKSGYVLSMATSHGALMDHLFVGGGIGVDSYSVKYTLDEDYPGFDPKHDKRISGVAIPMFVNVKGMWERNALSPVVDFKAGVTAGFVTGLFGEIGGGFRLRLDNRKGLSANLFAKAAAEPKKAVKNDSSLEEGQFVQLGVKLALDF